MKTCLRLIIAAAFAVLPTVAFAQADAHHPDAGAGAAPAPAGKAAPAPAAKAAPAPAAKAAPAPAAKAAPGPMTGNGADQTANMMQMMGQMMPMMQQMMQMMQSGMMGGNAGDALMSHGMSDASKAYVEAMRTMDAPMMRGALASDPDAAFVRAMIPHHQGAIDMAKAVLQYGKDERVKEWANQIVKAQEAEIAAMQDWLKQHAQ